MLRRITLDTNNDIYGQADNLYVKILNDETNIFELQYPTFVELEINSVPTGVYVADINIEIGKYTISIINDVLSREGTVRATITDTSYEDLSATTAGLSDVIDGIDTSISFS
ncbi:MAG: hypothetical protein KAI79_08315 [Bacteroidales bacterium]|nr:hypothetical protein [Bacteroidales bacterium]